jgi:hypothetical protein
MVINKTAKVLILYVVCMIIGQSAAVGVGLALDTYSPAVALAVFIPLYYVMYWAAWRIALFIGDRNPESVPDSSRDGGGSRAKAASWLLAPAVLALDFCD